MTVTEEVSSEEVSISFVDVLTARQNQEISELLHNFINIKKQRR